MNCVMQFMVPGRPVPYERMTQRSKWVDLRAQAYLAYTELVGWYAKTAGIKSSNGDVKLSCVFYVRPLRGQYPDLSNLVKAIEDGLQGIAYKNDRCVSRYGESERILVEDENEQRAEVRIESV